MYTFHHTAISVSDAGRSEKFYSFFGFKTAFTWEAGDGSLKIIQMKNGGFILELFCYKNPAPAPDTSKELSKDLPVIGVKHFGLRVDDIKKVKNELEKEGVAEGIEIIKGRTGIDYFFIKDPDGILMEILQDDRKAGMK